MYSVRGETRARKAMVQRVSITRQGHGLSWGGYLTMCLPQRARAQYTVHINKTNAKGSLLRDCLLRQCGDALSSPNLCKQTEFILPTLSPERASQSPTHE